MDEEIEKKRAEACTALTNMASVCIHERLILKEIQNPDVENMKKTLLNYFEQVIEKLEKFEKR